METFYRGRAFRSRLEARWAVFFDSLSVAYEYGKETYEIDGRPYPAGFRLPEFHCRAEIRPSPLNGPPR